MIPKSGYRFSEKIMLKQRGERDDDSKRSHHALSSAQRRQEPGHEPAALDQAVDQDVLVEGVIAGALDAEAVERRDAHRAGEVAVRAAAGALVRDVEAERLRDAARRLVER